MLAAAGLNMAAATMSLCVGRHWLDWRLSDATDRASRVSSFDLASRLHAVGALSLLVVTGFPGSVTAIVDILLWSGIVLFCGPLYAHGVLGTSRLMPIVLPGAITLMSGWIAFAASALL